MLSLQPIIQRFPSSMRKKPVAGTRRAHIRHAGCTCCDRKERTSMNASTAVRCACRRAAGAAVPAPHLLDATMFWSAAGGGVGRYLRDKRRWLQAHSHWRHTLVVAGAGGDVTVRGLPIPASGGYRFPLERRRATRQIAALAPDLIEAGDPYLLAWAALDAGQQLGVPTVAYCHSNIIEMAARVAGSPARSPARLYLRRVYRDFDAVFAASRWMTAELRELGLDNVVHQPLGVDLATFNPARRSADWRRRHGVPDDAIVLVYAGRFAAEKNMPVLAALPARLGPRFVLIAIGAGPQPPHGPRVRVLPYVGDPVELATALASADVFVHAGEQETFGLGPLEALACGTPLVVPARAGLLEIVDGDAAIGVGGATPQALCEGVLTALDGDRERRRFAAARYGLAFDANRAFAGLLARYSVLRWQHGPMPALAVADA
jgi:alpha-1,6-mannosyltransferase